MKTDIWLILTAIACTAVMVALVLDWGFRRREDDIPEEDYIHDAHVEYTEEELGRTK